MVEKKRWNGSREGFYDGKEEVEWKQGGSQWWKRRGGMEAGKVSMVKRRGRMEAGRVSMMEKKKWNGGREGLNGGKEEVEWKQGRSQWWKRRG
jgi:hypothetical protein